MKNKLSSIAGSVRAFIVRQLKPFAKSALRKALSSECAKLRLSLSERVRREGPVAVDKLFDPLQARLLAALNSARLIPPSIRERAAEAIQEDGDKLQARARLLVRDYGEKGVGMALAEIEELLLARIEAL